jgi:hypothetical protein
MRKVFSVAQFDTKTRKFADEVKTNGYAVSVTMIHPLTTTSVVAVEKKVPKKKKNDGASAAETLTKPQVSSPPQNLQGVIAYPRSYSSWGQTTLQMSSSGSTLACARW